MANESAPLNPADIALQTMLCIAIRFEKTAREIRALELGDSRQLSMSYQLSKIVERLAQDMREGCDDVIQGVMRHLDERYHALKARAL